MNPDESESLMETIRRMHEAGQVPRSRLDSKTSQMAMFDRVIEAEHQVSRLTDLTYKLRGEIREQRIQFDETLAALENERELYAKKFSELQAVANRLMELAHSRHADLGHAQRAGARESKENP